jgi:hypothetical protein
MRRHGGLSLRDPSSPARFCIGAKSYGMRSAFIDRRKRPFGHTLH